MEETKRVFFAVDLPQEVKREIYLRLSEKIPKDCWGKVKEENLHITLKFLGYTGKEKVKEIFENVSSLENFGAFEAELKGIGHFKGRVLWLGTGKGTDEFNALSNKLNDLLDLSDERFHAHVTLARNRGAKKKETDALIEELRKENYSAKIAVKGIVFFESNLTSKGPIYSQIFSVKFAE